MRIGELAATSGVSVRALRYYEEHGLLTSTRSASGHRRYGPSAAQRVDLIQQLYAAGIGSGGIRRLLPAVEAGRATSEVLAELRAERRRVGERIAELQRTAQRLDAVIEAAENPERECATLAPPHPPRHGWAGAEGPVPVAHADRSAQPPSLEHPSRPGQRDGRVARGLV